VRELGATKFREVGVVDHRECERPRAVDTLAREWRLSESVLLGAARRGDRCGRRPGTMTSAAAARNHPGKERGEHRQQDEER
jgi:hypothetical protein